MKLLNVNLQGFGQFNNGLNVDFSPDGLTVVYGRNEAGKSTLLSAIVGVLFGFRDLNLVRKYEPWDEYDAYGGEVSLTADDGRVLKISRDFKTHHATIIEVKDGEELPVFTGSADPRGNKEEDHNYFHILGDILGFQDESVFRNTVFFGQQCLQTAVSDQIRRLLTGSTDVDYKGALHELHSRFAELTENPWRSRGKARKRLIEETRSQLEEERTRLEDGRESLFRSLELEEELERLRQDLADLEGKRTDVADRLKLHTALGELLTRRETARKGYEEALARRDNFRRYADRAREIRGVLDKSYSHFKNAPDDLPEMVRTFSNEEEAIKNESLQLEQEGKRLAELRPDPNTGLGWFLFMLVAGIGVAVGSLTTIGLPAGAIGGLALGAAAFAIGRNIGTGYAQAKAAIENRITVLQTTIKKRSTQCEDIRERTGSLLVGRETEDVLREHARYKEFQEESMRLSAALSALGSQEDVNRKFEEAAREQGMVDANLARILEEEPDLAGMDDRHAVNAAVKALKEIADSLEEQIAVNRGRIEDHRVELAGLSARMDFDLAVLEEGIREKEHSLRRYDLERSALKESIDTLDECVKDFQEGDVFRLGEEITNLFSKITDEKYTRVHLGSSMDPVISRGDHVPISPADLSQGARDQLYFAMRVAMARHLSRNINLPLFLDDPFVNFDNERLHATKEVIDHLKGHQVVLVTCGREYRNWGRKLVDLDEVKTSAA